MKRILAWCSFGLLLGTNPALACDPCAIYNSARLQGHRPEEISVGMFEQLTTFDRAQALPENSIKDGDLGRDYSSTQFIVGYDLTDRAGLQLSLPLISRRYDEIQNYRSTTKTDTGLGDITLTGNYTFLNFTGVAWTASLGGFLGVEFPTGDSGSLQDESNDAIVGDVNQLIFKHSSIGGGAGSQEPTLGSGSYDYIFGGYGLLRYERFVAFSDLQYSIRTEGDYDYQFGNDLLTNFSPGYYIYLEHDWAVAGLVSFSGEFKDKDQIESSDVAGSGVSNLYLGPALIASFGDRLAGELRYEFRITDEDAGASVVPEAKIRASLGYRL